jgi:hypothetical protein
LDFSIQFPEMSSLLENMSSAEAKQAEPILHHSSKPESRSAAFSALDMASNSSKSSLKEHARRAHLKFGISLRASSSLVVPRKNP